jgi:hypothetical protein
MKDPPAGAVEAIRLLITVVLTSVVTALITWQLADSRWYEKHNGTVVLGPDIERIAPGESWIDVSTRFLPPKYQNSKVVIGLHPIQIQLSSAKGTDYLMSLRYDPSSGIVLENVQTDEILLRYDPDIGVIVGSGVPDSGYLDWIEHTYRPQNPFSTPILLIGARTESVVVNKLQIVSKVYIDPDTYVGRAYHTYNPSYTGTAVVRYNQTIFLADRGASLVNDVDWSAILANPDASAIVGGLVVTTNVLDAQRKQATSDATVWDDPGHLVVTVRKWSSDSTCTSFHNLADALVLDTYSPGVAISHDSSFFQAVADVDAHAHGNFSSILAEHPLATFRISNYYGVCKTSTGTIYVEVETVFGGGLQTVAVETQPVMCGPTNWQIVCQGSNTFWASVAS